MCKPKIEFDADIGFLVAIVAIIIALFLAE